MVYVHLYVRVGEFVRGYFGYGDLEGDGVEVGSGGVWAEGGVGRGLRWFVEQVAKQDNNGGGWDEMLVKRGLREYLVTGMIGKALETCVFEELLFGADEHQAGMLEAQDKCTLNHDGESLLWEVVWLPLTNTAQDITAPLCAHAASEPSWETTS
jgi:hypothetical protein